jgi:hypothetical protein
MLKTYEEDKGWASEQRKWTERIDEYKLRSTGFELVDPSCARMTCLRQEEEDGYEYESTHDTEDELHNAP